MDLIKRTYLVTNSDSVAFHKKLDDMICELQHLGLSVEIQFSTSGQGVYSALVLGRG